VLDGPHRIEARVVRNSRDVELLVEDLAVRAPRPGSHGLTALLRLVPIPVGVVLVEDGRTYAHVLLLSDAPWRCFRRRLSSLGSRSVGTRIRRFTDIVLLNPRAGLTPRAPASLS